jgi:hypothetical protein
MNVFILTGEDSSQDIWDAILGVFETVELAKASSAIKLEDGTVIPSDDRNWEGYGRHAHRYSFTPPANTAKYAVYDITPHFVINEKSQC